MKSSYLTTQSNLFGSYIAPLLNIWLYLGKIYGEKIKKNKGKDILLLL